MIQGQDFLFAAAKAAQALTTEDSISVRVVSKQLAGLAETTIDHLRKDGSIVSSLIPIDVPRALTEHRKATNSDGKGTWYTATFVVTLEGKLDANFEYDAEPKWDEPIPVALYATDNELFPRDSEIQPDWLKNYLAESDSNKLVNAPAKTQQECVLWAANAAQALLPPDGATVTVTSHHLAGISQTFVDITTLGGHTSRTVGSYDLNDALDAHRLATVRQGSAPWYTAVLTIDRAGKGSADFTATAEPQWTTTLPRDAYKRDLAVFPRATEFQPEWLQAKIAEGTSGA